MTAEVKPKDGFVEVNGLKLHYLDWGNPAAQPMLLVHGSGTHAHTWDVFAAAVANVFHIVAYDQRGHGDSDWAAPYPPDAYDSDMNGVVQALSLHGMVLLGLSLGGRNAFHYAAAHPEEVERLVIVDAGPGVTGAQLEVVKNLMLATDEFDTEEDAFRYERGRNPRPDDAQIWLRVHDNLKQLPNGKLTWKYDRILRDSNVPRLRPTAEESWEAVQGIKCPTLLVRGAESDILAPETAERMQREIANCTLVTVAGSGHSVSADQPVEFERVVRHWLGV